MALSGAIALLAMLAGCADKRVLPYLGKWEGDLILSARDGKVAPAPLQGSLFLYATESKFRLIWEGEQQGVTVNGTWKAQEGRIVLRPREVQIDDRGGERKRDPNRSWVEPNDLRAAYGRDVVLVLSKDKQRLVGLEVAVGPRTGTHQFVKKT